MAQRDPSSAEQSVASEKEFVRKHDKIGSLEKPQRPAIGVLARMLPIEDMIPPSVKPDRHGDQRSL